MSLKHIEGKEQMFYVKKDNVFLPCACLTSSPMSEDVEMLPTTTRENEGWRTSQPTNQGYSFEISGLAVLDDEYSGNSVVSYRELRRMKRNKELIEWQRKTLDGYYIDSGKAHITSISDSDEADGFITFSASLVGFGKPEEDFIIKGLGMGNVLITNNEKGISNGY